MSQRLSTAALRAAVMASTLATTAGLAVLPAVAAPVAPAAPASPSVAHVARSAPAAAPAAVSSSALQNALGKIGSPYRYGATGPSAFDCSGLVHWAFEQEGVTLPRTSRAMSTAGSPVSRSALRPGDLVFFYRPVSHVGMYVGNGQVVHASTSGKPVKLGDLDAMPFHSARRV